MRLRNIPRAESVLTQCGYVIKDEKNYQGKWAEVFGNNRPVRIEIGMGKGRFLLTLARENPEVNYIGIERYSSVLLRAVEGFYELKETGDAPENVRFICMDAAEIPEVFSAGEVDRVYLNFSDPWPKARHARRRLTSKEYFARYDKILKSGGTVEFKTDNKSLFDFSLEQLGESKEWETMAYTYDLHHHESMNEGNVMTEYEEKFSSLGNPICKLIAGRHSQG